MKRITLNAGIESIEPLTDWVNEILASADCPVKAQMQIDVAIDELISNVAYYAYPGGQGTVTLEAELRQDPKGLLLVVDDTGVAYDPLQKEDPDITLSAEERKIGGLGIYMVKKSMTSMEYERKDGHNRLSVFKAF